jgi:hypothetical protein
MMTQLLIIISPCKERYQVLQTAQVALCNLVERNIDLEEGRGRFTRMFGTYLPDYTALDPRRLFVIIIIILFCGLTEVSVFKTVQHIVDIIIIIIIIIIIYFKF